MDTTAWVIVITLIASLGGIACLFWRARRRRLEEPVFHFACPHCQRRFGYRVRQAGHQVVCSRCRKAFIFPRSAALVPAAGHSTRR